MPLLAYNTPSRTGQELTVDTIAELAGIETVVGVKDATGDVARVTRERLRLRKPFSLLSGDDATALGYRMQGGHGCISVTANIAPRLCARLQALADAGDMHGAYEIHAQLMPLNDALFLEPSPVGIKYAMSKLGLCRHQLRAPLLCAEPATREAIDDALARLALSEDQASL